MLHRKFKEINTDRSKEHRVRILTWNMLAQGECKKYLFDVCLTHALFLDSKTFECCLQLSALERTTSSNALTTHWHGITDG